MSSLSVFQLSRNRQAKRRLNETCLCNLTTPL